MITNTKVHGRKYREYGIKGGTHGEWAGLFYSEQRLFPYGGKN